MAVIVFSPADKTHIPSNAVIITAGTFPGSKSAPILPKIWTGREFLLGQMGMSR
jgi:hypothetical protein